MKVAIICIIQSFNNFQKSKIYKIGQAKIEVAPPLEEEFSTMLEIKGHHKGLEKIWWDVKGGWMTEIWG